MTQEHDAETVRVARAIYHAAHPKSGEWHWLDSAKQKRFVRQARAALSAMPTREVTCWQPIETAPKDGTRFLGLAKKGAWASTCYYVGPTSRHPGNNLDWFMGVDGWPQPTHWMPLPPAPEVK